ncbi:unnamed protein product, partial [marine sediment metagenome]
ETGGEGGGHTSDPENNVIRQKEPPNAPDHDRIMSKGVLKQYKNRYPKPAVQKTTPDHPPTREKTNITTTVIPGKPL